MGPGRGGGRSRCRRLACAGSGRSRTRGHQRARTARCVGGNPAAGDGAPRRRRAGNSTPARPKPLASRTGKQGPCSGTLAMRKAKPSRRSASANWHILPAKAGTPANGTPRLWTCTSTMARPPTAPGCWSHWGTWKRIPSIGTKPGITTAGPGRSGRWRRSPSPTRMCCCGLIRSQPCRRARPAPAPIWSRRIRFTTTLAILPAGATLQCNVAGAP